MLTDPVASAVLTTHQAAALPADVAGVLLDGVAVPPTQVSQPDSVDIAVRTGALPTDVLAAGTHTLSFQATVGTGAGTGTSSSATLSGLQGADLVSLTSPPVSVQVNQPDIAVVLTPDSGEGQTGSAGTGQDLYMGVDITNAGYGTPTATMEIDLPVGLVLGSEGVSRDSDGSLLDCGADPAQPQHILCALGVLSHPATGSDPTIVLDLITTKNPPVGQIAPITVSAAPDPGQGVDTDTSNNSVTAHIEFTGSAALSYVISPAKTKVELGGETTVKVTVHNSGPQQATNVIGFVLNAGDSFAITGFTGNSEPPAGSQGGAYPGSPTSAAGRRQPLGWGNAKPQLAQASAAASGNAPVATKADGRLWFLGDIPSGGSVSAVLTLKAVKLGTSQAQVLAFSSAGDPNCPDQACDPASVDLEAIAVTAPVVPTPIATPPAAPVSTVPVVLVPQGTGSQPVLANTGADSTPALGLGGALLVGGAMLLFLTRRRTSSNR